MIDKLVYNINCMEENQKLMQDLRVGDKVVSIEE